MNIEVYTDGACDNRSGCGGWGVYIPTNEFIPQAESYSGPIENCRSNKAEIIAATKGISHVAPYFPLDEKANLTVYTDSMYVIHGITQWIYNWEHRNWKTSEGNPVKNKEEWQELAATIKTLPKGVNVIWKHVKDHSGNFGNDRADELAIEGRELAKKNRKIKGVQASSIPSYFTEDFVPEEPLELATNDRVEESFNDLYAETEESTTENKILLGYIVVFGLVQTGLLVLILVTLVITNLEEKDFYMECFTAERSIRCVMEPLKE